MKTTIAIAFAHLLVVPCFAGAGAPDKPSPSLSPGIDRNRVYFDAPGDGALWARGESWKMSFGAEGATYVPRFVSREETSLPHRLSPDLVTVGEGPLAFERAVTAVRSGNRVEFDRGAFVEAYELEPRSLEQSFVFASLPRAGDLVLRIPITRELPAEIQAFEDAGGVALGNELGSVHYSRAVATDAAGERIDASTRIEDGSIVIRVDGVALATAAFPLVIDPVVTDVWINTTLENDQTPDVAWDPIEGVWMVVASHLGGKRDLGRFRSRVRDDRLAAP